MLKRLIGETIDAGLFVDIGGGQAAFYPRRRGGGYILNAAQQHALRTNALWLGLAGFGLMVLPWVYILDGIIALTGDRFVGIGLLAAVWAVVLVLLLPALKMRERQVVGNSAGRDPAQRADDMALFQKQKEVIVIGVFLGLLPALILAKMFLYFLGYTLFDL